MNTNAHKANGQGYSAGALSVVASLLFLVLGSSFSLNGAVYYQVGSSSFSWPTTWTALTGANTDANNGLSRPQVDFVGDAANPVGYYAQNGDYIAFRMRVAYAATVDASTFRDSLFVLIDRVGYGNLTGLPDYAFVWDSYSNDNANHGLEMMTYDSGTTTWSTVTMKDIDGSETSKGENDISGGGRDTEGFVRTVDGQPTTNFGNTTFVDFAVAWNYLEPNTNLSSFGESWKITFASVSNNTDATALSGDISGGANPGDTVSTTPWNSAITTNPEPGSMALLALGSAGSLWWQRRRKAKKVEIVTESAN